MMFVEINKTELINLITRCYLQYPGHDFLCDQFSTYTGGFYEKSTWNRELLSTCSDEELYKIYSHCKSLKSLSSSSPLPWKSKTEAKKLLEASFLQLIFILSDLKSLEKFAENRLDQLAFDNLLTTTERSFDLLKEFIERFDL